LQEALEDSGHPVFSLPAKELKNNKHPEHFFHFGRGDAYFYIPPFPARGEVSAYNFIAAFDYWKHRAEKLNKKSDSIKLRVINAN
jgi:hypothetical protein